MTPTLCGAVMCMRIKLTRKLNLRKVYLSHINVEEVFHFSKKTCHIMCEQSKRGCSISTNRELISGEFIDQSLHLCYFHSVLALHILWDFRSIVNTKGTNNIEVISL